MRRIADVCSRQVRRVAADGVSGVAQHYTSARAVGPTLGLVVENRRFFVERDDAGERKVLLRGLARIQVGEVDVALSLSIEKCLFRSPVPPQRDTVGRPDLIDLVRCFQGPVMIEPVAKVSLVVKLGGQSDSAVRCRPGNNSSNSSLPDASTISK